jgi:hypothetical protein
MSNPIYRLVDSSKSHSRGRETTRISDLLEKRIVRRDDALFRARLETLHCLARARADRLAEAERSSGRRGRKRTFTGRRERKEGRANMKQVKVVTEVVGYLFDAQVWLEGIETKLAYDGDKTRKSTDIVETADDQLEITFHGVGIADTEWELTLTQIKADGTSKDLYKKKGSIRSTGHSLILDSVKVE